MRETTNLQLDARRDSGEPLARYILKKQDVAKVLGVTERTVDRYVSQGWLRVHRLGPGPKAPQRFFIEEVLEDIRSRCSSSGPGGAD